MEAVWVDAERVREMFDPPVSLSTVRAWTAKGLLPHMKIGNPHAKAGGGRVYYDPAAVKAALESRFSS